MKVWMILPVRYEQDTGERQGYWEPAALCRTEEEAIAAARKLNEEGYRGTSSASPSNRLFNLILREYRYTIAAEEEIPTLDAVLSVNWNDPNNRRELLQEHVDILVTWVPLYEVWSGDLGG